MFTFSKLQLADFHLGHFVIEMVLAFINYQIFHKKGLL